MRNLLRDLSLIGKVISGVLATGVVPGATPLRVILLYIVVAIFKDVADNFYNQVSAYVGTLKQTTTDAASINGHTVTEVTRPLYPEAQAPKPGAPASNLLPPGAQARTALLATLVVFCFALTGCSSSTAPSPAASSTNASPTVTTSTAPTPAQVQAALNNYAYSVANVLQTQNNGQTLQTTAVNDALTLAGASPKTQAQAAIVNSLTSLVGNVIIAAHNANVPATATQSTVNGALTPAAVAATAQAAVTNAAPVVQPSGSLWHPPGRASIDLVTASF